LVKLVVDLTTVLPYTMYVVNFLTHRRSKMDANATIEAVKKFCQSSSGDPQIWSGNKATYHWNIGKVTSQGIVNGVVRKLAGIDVSGKQIWAVAGSFKIMPDGTIARFTGLSKKFQSQIIVAQPTVVNVQDTVTV
jgi:hypothetical protein